MLNSNDAIATINTAFANLQHYGTTTLRHNTTAYFVIILYNGENVTEYLFITLWHSPGIPCKRILLEFKKQIWLVNGNEISFFISFHFHLFTEGKGINYVYINCFPSCPVQRQKKKPKKFTIGEGEGEGEVAVFSAKRWDRRSS